MIILARQARDKHRESTEKQMRFLTGARTGKEQIIGNATVGYATLRRDGFASIEAAPGSTTALAVTHSLIFSGSHFFVNAGMKQKTPAASEGDGGQCSITVAVLDDSSGTPIAPFTHENCAQITSDDVRQAVTWKGVADLSSVAGKAVRLVFKLNGAAALYSFWVSSSKCGESQVRRRLFCAILYHK